MFLGIISKSNFLKKILALSLLFSFSVLSVEAKIQNTKKRSSVERKSARAPKAPKVRVPKVLKVKASKALKVRALKVKASKAPKIRAPKVLKVKASKASKVRAPKVLTTLKQKRSQQASRKSVSTKPLKGKAAKQREAVRMATAKEVARLAEEATRIQTEQQAIRTAAEALRLSIEEEIVRAAAENARIFAETARMDAEREAARIAAERAEATRLEVIEGVRRLNVAEFLNRGFVKTPGIRMTADARNPAALQLPVDYQYADLGYEGRARTRQYGDGRGQLAIPAAPVDHPYWPEQELVEKGYEDVAFLVNVKIPNAVSTFTPPALLANLMDIPKEKIDRFMVFQDMPWYDDLRGVEDDPLRAQEPWLAGLAKRMTQLKPQYWLNPDAPFEDPVAHSEQFNVSVGVFSKQAGGPHICSVWDVDGNLAHGDQPEGGVINHGVSIHNTYDKDGVVTNPQLISSAYTLSIGNLDMNKSQVLYYLTLHKDQAGNVIKGAITKMVKLNQRDQEITQHIVARSRNMVELKETMRDEKQHRGCYHDLDLDEVFDFH